VDTSTLNVLSLYFSLKISMWPKLFGTHTYVRRRSLLWTFTAWGWSQTTSFTQISEFVFSGKLLPDCDVSVASTLTPCPRPVTFIDSCEGIRVHVPGSTTIGTASSCSKSFAVMSGGGGL